MSRLLPSTCSDELKPPVSLASVGDHMETEKVIPPVTPSSNDLASEGKEVKEQNQETSFTCKNLFDLALFNSTEEMENGGRLVLNGSVHRTPKRLRVKRYNGNGDELSNDSESTGPESLPAHTMADNSLPPEYHRTISPQPRNGIPMNGSTPSRIKHYSAEAQTPVVVSSGSEDGGSEHHADDAPSGRPTGPVHSYDQAIQPETGILNTSGESGASGAGYAFHDGDDDSESHEERQYGDQTQEDTLPKSIAAHEPRVRVPSPTPDAIAQGQNVADEEPKPSDIQNRTPEHDVEHDPYVPYEYSEELSQPASEVEIAPEAPGSLRQKFVAYDYTTETDYGTGSDSQGYATDSSSEHEGVAAPVSPPTAHTSRQDPDKAERNVPLQSRKVPDDGDDQPVRGVQEPYPGEAQAVTMASLARSAADKRVPSQATEEQVGTTGKQYDEEGDLKPAESDFTSRRATLEDRRNAALAIASAAQQKKGNLKRTEVTEKPRREAPEPERMVQLRATPVKVQSLESDSATEQEPKRTVEFKSLSERQDDLRNRRQELEQRKRELETVARESAARRESEGPTYDGSGRKLYTYPKRKRSVTYDLYTGEEVREEARDRDQTEGVSSRHTSTSSDGTEKRLYSYPPPKRTVMIDVYTGEVIGSMPKVTSMPKVKPLLREKSGIYSDDSSDDSSTSYDIPVNKKQQVTFWLLVLLLLAGAGLGVYFGVFFERDDDNNRELPSEPPTAEGNGGPTQPQVAPTWAPTATPVAPTWAPTAAPTKGPTTAAPTFDSLLSLLTYTWPSLTEALLDESSPQAEAVKWLSQNQDLASYSDKRKVQRFALSTLYYSTGGEVWLNNDLWLSNADECLWFSSSSRLQCDDGGSYVGLNLGLNDLSGTIPSELVLLTRLTRLDIATARDGALVSGSLPTEFGQLSSLEHVNLQGNRLSGPIPPEVGNWRNLTSLNLSQNRFSGVLPTELGLLTVLTDLSLQENRLEGSLPTTVGSMEMLTKMILTSNNLQGPIPMEIGNLESLQTLSLGLNQFSSLPTNIGNLNLLQALLLPDNDIQGSIPSEVGNLSSLLELDLSRNALTGAIPTEVGRMLEIRLQLDLSQNDLSGPIPVELGSLVFLQSLRLHRNRLTGGVPDSFQFLEALTTLRLESNDLSGNLPNPVCDTFDSTYPVFVADCPLELVCPCCSYCCVDNGGCVCQFQGTDEEFRCSGEGSRLDVYHGDSFLTDGPHSHLSRKDDGETERGTLDLQELLDFAIIGHGKCGTTSIQHWLSEGNAKDYIHSPYPELLELSMGTKQQFIDRIYQEYKQSRNKLIHGYKNPGEIRIPDSIRFLSRFFPKTVLMVGIRHPVLWFESLFNFKVQNIPEHIPPNYWGDANDRIGDCVDPLVFNCVGTHKGLFHVHLAYLGKTEQTQGLEQEYKFLQGNVTPTANPVFLFDVDQLNDDNSTRTVTLQHDLEDILGLKRYNVSLGQPPRISPGKQWPPKLQRQRDKEKISICDDHYIPLRGELMKISQEASLWIRTSGFLDHPDVHVSSRDYLEYILATKWMKDPCETK